MIFIPFNTASSKNSKRWTGRMLINSPTVMRYKKQTKQYWENLRPEFLKLLEGKQKPYRIEFFLIRDSKRKFDYVNAVQLPLDLMQEYNWLEDDCADEVIPVFKGYKVDKLNAGIEINVV